MSIKYVVDGLLFAGTPSIILILYYQRKNLWHWLRAKQLQFFPAQFDIGFSLDFNKEKDSENYYVGIIENLRQLIDDYNLNSHIKLRDFSDTKKFSNRKEAEEFTRAKKLNLVIWGGFSGDGLKSKGRGFSKVKLNFTYGYLDTTTRLVGRVLWACCNLRDYLNRFMKIVKSSFVLLSASDSF